MMVPDVILLGIGTVLSYVSSIWIHDGVLGGTVVMSLMLLTLRGILKAGKTLHPANAWVVLGVFAGYSLVLTTLPRCYIDRYGSRFCRETDPDRLGRKWLTGLMIVFFLFGCLIIYEPSNQIRLLGVAGSLCIVLGVGVVMYGMKSVPITQRETQQLSLKGAFADTSVRILPARLI